MLAAKNAELNGTQWAPEDVIVMKRNPMLNTRHLELLSDAPTQKLSQLRINEGVNLFAESSQEKHPQGAAGIGDMADFKTADGTDISSLCKWEIEFELDQNRFHIKFNAPSAGSKQAPIPETALTAQDIQDAQ